MLLAAVASVSLVVGGVGIMNIMLVSVTERTREIGMRLAVGARSRDVLRQFLLEAVMLSLVGGLVGIALAMVGAWAIADLLQWPTRMSPAAIGVAFAFAAAIGIFFGFYPARRAAASIRSRHCGTNNRKQDPGLWPARAIARCACRQRWPYASRTVHLIFDLVRMPLVEPSPKSRDQKGARTGAGFHRPTAASNRSRRRAR